MGGSQPHGIYGAHSLYTRHQRISTWQWGFRGGVTEFLRGGGGSERASGPPPDPQDPPGKNGGGSQPHRSYGAHSLYTRQWRISRWQWGFLGGLWGFFGGGGGHKWPQDPPSPKGPPRKKKRGDHNPMEAMGRTASIRDIRESQYGSGLFWGGLWVFFGGGRGSERASGPPLTQRTPPRKKKGEGHNPMESMGRTASIRDIRESPDGSGGFGGGYGVFVAGGGHKWPQDPPDP